MSETVAPAAPETTASPATAPTQPSNVAPTRTVLTEGAAPPPAAPVVPEKYEFAAPVIDGQPIEVDTAALGTFEAAAREAGLSQDQFAKVATLGAQLVQQKVAEAISNAVPEHLRPATQDAWINAIKSDPEIGGDKLQATIAAAGVAIDKFGGPELREALNITKGGNNPAIVKAFAAVGRAMDEAGGLLTGRPAAGSKAPSPEQAARDFYNAAGGAYPPVGS